MSIRRYAPIATLSIGFTACAVPLATPPQPPKLVLQITVDQLRADLPMRYADRLGEGGFRYLWQNGAVYVDAHHAHANTETVVGHATLATGAHPAEHGMIGNLWVERSTGELRYNIEDARHHLLTRGADVDKGSEIDPTQRAARSEGRSPAALLVTTFSDELVSHSGGRAKAFGVSVKDRGAVTLAGHTGKAFWFSKASGEFVTSDYYYDRYPDWVEAWNRQGKPQAYANTHWELRESKDSYVFGATDDRPWETDLGGFGRTFPHPYGPADSKYFTTLLTISPAGDELTLDFAKTLLDHEELGQDAITDYLSVSFSSTDYVGHLFGPSSLESEAQILELDRIIAELLAHVDERVGLENTLIVLSADHGGPDTPGYLKSLGIPAGYVDPDTWDKDAAIERIKEQYEIRGPLIEKYSHPYLYLAKDIVEGPADRRQWVEQAVVRELNRFEGVALAVSSRDLEHADIPDTLLHEAVRRNFHPGRSGDVYVVFAPNWFINDFDGLHVASTHGSPWAYDTHVPLVFAGPSVRPQRVARRVHTVDVATTLAARLGLKMPSGASGQVLPEVFGR